MSLSSLIRRAAVAHEVDKVVWRPEGCWFNPWLLLDKALSCMADTAVGVCRRV